MMSPATIGPILRHAREQRGLSIQTVAERTKIKPRYIELMESDAVAEMPSMAQAKGFLRAYADFLGLSYEELLASLASPAPSGSSSPSREESASPAGPALALAPDAILAEIGESLVRQRKLLGLSLTEAAEHTHIPEHYLEYMETGKFGEFPSSVQARGMLGSYAGFLQADEDALLLRFADALQAGLAERQATAAPRRRSFSGAGTAPRFPRWLRRYVSLEVAAIAFAVVAISGLVIAIVGRVLSAQAGHQAPPTAPALVLALLPSATHIPTVTPEALTSPTPQIPGEGGAGEITPTLSAVGQSEIQVFLIITQRTYLKVIVDGRVAFDGRALPGANLPYGARESVEVLAGNGAGVQAIYNQQDLGALGLFGEVVHLLFRADGVLTPTPAVTPLPPTVSPTPAATSTP